MKVFEQIVYEDGGPNDNGTIIGYHKGTSSKQLEEKFDITNNFMEFYEITLTEYHTRKRAAERNLKMFNL